MKVFNIKGKSDILYMERVKKTNKHGLKNRWIIHKSLIVGVQMDGKYDHQELGGVTSSEHEEGQVRVSILSSSQIVKNKIIEKMNGSEQRRSMT